MTTIEEKTLVQIGTVDKPGERRLIRVASEYAQALAGLEGFSHVIVVWWADRYAEYRGQVDMVIDLPYAPGVRSGLFATRSPVRPNPIGMNVARVVAVDAEAGLLELDEIDAYAGTIVIDIKPYYGCLDRVQEYRQPEWVPAQWGEWYTPIPEIDYGE